MGMFTLGYQDGVKSVTQELTQEKVLKTVNELTQDNRFDELEEWFNGFYKGILEAQVEAVRVLKKETLQE